MIEGEMEGGRKKEVRNKSREGKKREGDTCSNKFDYWIISIP